MIEYIPHSNDLIKFSIGLKNETTTFYILNNSAVLGEYMVAHITHPHRVTVPSVQEREPFRGTCTTKYSATFTTMVLGRNGR